ncbi:MAG: 2Fe-2S iron-sulfur cluster-binding protein [Polyangiales bacterium]
MPTFKIDGQEVPFEPGDSIIRAAWRKGIEIPHYCWHPGLSVAANCRMCLVEVTSGRPMMMPILKWDPAKNDYVPAVKPKLQPACQTPAAEGLEIATKSPEVLKTQAAVQEFLLLNHPVDCPICDQAGECKLQDYWAAHQHRLKRKKTEPVHKPKGVRFGPTIVYDAERCIMCTRCIRVCNEVAKDPVLDMRERGNKNEIVLAPGRQLDHAYSLMTEHVCPVGALTSRDFRFKARVWFLKSAPSVCGGCATGCNAHVDFDPRNGKVYRLRPRDNEAVNKFWMCDDGMMSYRRQDEDRVLTAFVGRGDERVPAFVDEGLAAATEAFQGVAKDRIAVVLSAAHSTEDNHVAARLAKQLGTAHVYLAAAPGWAGDAVLRNADANPNRAGALAAAAGLEPKPLSALLADVASGAVQGVVALGSVSEESLEALSPLAKLTAFVSVATHVGALPATASVVLPAATHFETNGTFVNAKGMAQRFRRAVTAPVDVEPAWHVLARLGHRLGVKLDYTRLEDVRGELERTGGALASLVEARA